jgi:hypothetical protein
MRKAGIILILIFFFSGFLITIHAQWTDREYKSYGIGFKVPANFTVVSDNSGGFTAAGTIFKMSISPWEDASVTNPIVIFKNIYNVVPGSKKTIVKDSVIRDLNGLQGYQAYCTVTQKKKLAHLFIGGFMNPANSTNFTIWMIYWDTPDQNEINHQAAEYIFKNLKVTDSALLARNSPFTVFRHINFAGCENPALLAMIEKAFLSVPEINREYLMLDILPAIAVLIDPEVVKEVGKIVSIETGWRSKFAYYSKFGPPGNSNMKTGERFKCSIQLERLPKKLSYSWETFFGKQTNNLDFQPAVVDPSDLLGTVFERLPQPLLAKIAEDYDSDIGEGAVKKMTDQALLAEIAQKNSESFVRSSAAEKLTDQTLLKKIVSENNYYFVRCSAIKKITDTSELIKIATGIDVWDRQCAIEVLTDEALLEKLTRDIDARVREWAESRLKVLRNTEKK